MAIGFYTGFEGQSAAIDNITITGTASYSTAQKRTGAASILCNPASAASGYIAVSSIADYYHFGIYITTLPNLGNARVMMEGGNFYLSLKHDVGDVATIIYWDGAYGGSPTSVGSAAGLQLNTWYWIGVRAVSGNNVALLQVNGVDRITGTLTTSSNITSLGFSQTESLGSIAAHFDDFIANSEFLQPSKVANLVPISDSANTGWVRGAGSTTTNLYIPVSTAPPPGVASANETDNTNIECASNSANNYTANLTTYATAGINSPDTVLAVQPIIRHGEDIATNTKAGTIELTSNPTISTISFNFGNDAGAHGAEAGSWFTTFAGITTSPSITRTSSPVMRVIKTTASTRVACVDYMALVVAWTPYTAKVTAQAQAQIVGRAYGQAMAGIKTTSGTYTFPVQFPTSLQSNNATYSTAASGSNLSTTGSNIGQNTGYYVYESFFELLNLPWIDSSASISNAVFRLTISTDNSSTDFTIYIGAYDFGVSVGSEDWRTSAQLQALTPLASYDTSLGSGND